MVEQSLSNALYPCSTQGLCEGIEMQFGMSDQL